MAEKQPKTCEEYVLEDLFKTKNELALVKKELQETNEVHSELKSHHVKMFELLVLALAGARVEKENDLYCIYLESGYVGCYTEYGLESKKEEAIKLYALTQLIELVQRTPTREE